MLPRWSSSRAYCSQLCRGHASSNPRASFARSLAAAKSPRKISTQLRCNRIRWMCKGFSTSRQCRRHGSRRSSASSQRLDGQARRPKYSQHLDTSWARRCLGDRGIGFVDKALALCSIARRPFRRRPFQFRSGRSQSPSALPCAGAGTLKPRLGRRQPAGLDTEPAVPGGADDEQEVVELVAPGCSQWRLSPAPTAGLTARAGRRRRARWRRESAHR